MEDMFIRRFMNGTWPNLFLSEVRIRWPFGVAICCAQCGIVLDCVVRRGTTVEVSH